MRRINNIKGGFYMAVMYLAKLSMSSDIYKFYEETSLFDDYLKKVYLAINNKHTIQDEFEKHI